MSRLYIVTLLTELLCSVHHVKCWAGWSTSWSQDCQEKYQQLQICRWYHSNGRKWRGTNSLLMKVKEESEKVGSKLSIQEIKIMASSHITSWQMKWSESHSVMSNSLWPHGLYSPWNPPGQNTGVGSLSLLQGITPTQGSNPVLPHCKQTLYHLSHQGTPSIICSPWLSLG